MIKNKIIIISAIITVSCAANPTSNYADSLIDCMSSEDVDLLNESCDFFETKLVEKYKEKDISKAYRLYLKDIASFNVPPSFWVNPESKSILQKFRPSGTFNKIWTKLSEIKTSYSQVVFITADGEFSVPPEEDILCINHSGIYFNCIMKLNKSEAVNNYLTIIKSSPNITMSVTAHDLYTKLSDDDLKVGLTRLIITIGFYYQMVVLFE